MSVSEASLTHSRISQAILMNLICISEVQSVDRASRHTSLLWNSKVLHFALGRPLITRAS